ncbi:MAG: hypothetical protein ACYTBX_00625 [Planctomycetota bacterium]
MLRTPLRHRRRSGSVPNIPGGVLKRRCIGSELTLDDYITGGRALHVILRELDIRVGNGGTGRNKDPGKPQTYRLYITNLHKLQVTAAEVHTPRRSRALFNTILRVLDSALPHYLAKDDICTGQSQYHNKRS